MQIMRQRQRQRQRISEYVTASERIFQGSQGSSSQGLDESIRNVGVCQPGREWSALDGA